MAAQIAQDLHRVRRVLDREKARDRRAGHARRSHDGEALDLTPERGEDGGADRPRPSPGTARPGSRKSPRPSRRSCPAVARWRGARPDARARRSWRRRSPKTFTGYGASWIEKKPATVAPVMPGGRTMARRST